jgi:simple sugar transport system permease protein
VTELLGALWSVALLASAVRLAIPLLLAGTGEIVSERAGVLNIGLEGMMLAGSFGAVVVAWKTGDPWLGLLGGSAAAILIAIPHGIASITFAGDQVVSGIALNLGSLGLTTYLARALWGTGEARPEVAHFTPVEFPFLFRIPLIGPVLFRQSPLLYLALGLTLVVAVLLWRTRWGLACRAAGEDPAALAAAGVEPTPIRWQALLCTATFAGLGGAAISLGQLYTFVENMTGGRGFIALAVVIVCQWRPGVAVLAVLFFGLLEALAIRIQAAGAIDIPYQLAQMLPYLASLIAYALVSRSGKAPRALGRPYLAP